MLNFALFMFGHCPHHVRSPFVSTQTLDLWAEATDFGGLGAGDDVKGTLSPKFDDHVHGFQNGNRKEKCLQKSSPFLCVCACYKHYNIIKHTKEKAPLCDHGRRMSPPQFLVLARISTGLWVTSSMLHSEKSMVQLL